MSDFEKLGVFYLGREFDPAAGKATTNPILYDAKDLTTHAVCVGMTGSGKTGLCVSLLEEAAIDGIPAIAIDPKGDIANILLTFPNLEPSDFRPWIDPAEAARKGLTPDDYAKQTAEMWRKGLADWGQDASRIARLQQSVEMAVYTPGNSAGRPLAILRSFDAPSEAMRGDVGAMRDRVMSAVSGLLGLLGITADPIQSREHILLSTILNTAWMQGRGLDLAGVIQEVQKPSFDKIGVFDLESFYPAKERFGLAMALNNLLASPGFAAWMSGESLDVQRLLYTPEGKPRLSVISIAHLSDAERMFFVTILLNEVLSWVRAQSGTSSLRALLYMDEVFGYFPPNAMPPSKLPMLTLLKQARAFGLGVVLATQNPVDLDYKGLGNTGTWFLGRLQTERDKMRVIEGLKGAAMSSGGNFDRAEFESLLSSLGNRVFLMRNVHEDQPVLLQSRWALSYLRGPMTLPQIQTVMSGVKSSAPAATISAAPVASSSNSAAKPPVAGDVSELFLRPKASDGKLTYKPQIAGTSKLHFVDAKSGVDTWVTYSHLAPISDDGKEALWEESETHADVRAACDRAPASGSSFDELPGPAARAASYKAWQETYEDFLYQTVTLDLCACPSLKLSSQPNESEGDFKARVAQAMRERRDIEVEKIRKKYAPKLQTLQDQIRRAEDKLAKQKSQVTSQTMNTVLSIGATLLGAFMGRKVMSATNVSRAASTVRSASRIGSEKQDVADATESLEVLQQRFAAMNTQIEEETTALFRDSSIPKPSRSPRPPSIRANRTSLSGRSRCCGRRGGPARTEWLNPLTNERKRSCRNSSDSSYNSSASNRNRRRVEQDFSSNSRRTNSAVISDR
jgi:hypothetical protein